MSDESSIESILSKKQTTEIDTATVNTNISNMIFQNLRVQNQLSKKLSNAQFNSKFSHLEDGKINFNMKKYTKDWVKIISLESDENNPNNFYQNDEENIRISLFKIIDNCYYEGHVKLINKLESEYLIIKFINDKIYYSITPSFIFIKPEGEVIINIKRFDKYAPDQVSIKVYDSLSLVVAKTKNKIEDINDAILYVRKEDLATPNFDIYITLDNGNDYNTYNKVIEMRKNNIDKFYEQLNINGLKDPLLIKEEIEKLQQDIKDYKKKMLEVHMELTQTNKQKEDINENKNDFNKEIPNKKKEIEFNNEVFYEIDKKNKEINSDNVSDNENVIKKKKKLNTFMKLTHDENGIALPLLVFYLSICLFNV